MWTLATAEGRFTGHRTTLNGVELKLTAARELPPLPPRVLPASGALLMPRLSITFVTLPEAQAEACM